MRLGRPLRGEHRDPGRGPAGTVQEGNTMIRRLSICALVTAALVLVGCGGDPAAKRLVVGLYHLLGPVRSSCRGRCYGSTYRRTFSRMDAFAADTPTTFAVVEVQPVITH